MLGLTFDQWMNVSGMLGIILTLLSCRRQLRSPEHVPALYRLLYLIGFTLLIIPLFLRWYLTGPLIVACSLLLALFCGAMWLKTRNSA